MIMIGQQHKAFELPSKSIDNARKNRFETSEILRIHKCITTLQCPAGYIVAGSGYSILVAATTLFALNQLFPIDSIFLRHKS